MFLPSSTPSRLVLALVALLALLSGELFPLKALARSCRVSQLPNGSRNGCANCHTSRFGGGARNPFGNAVGNITGFQCTNFWGPALAAEDADADGLTNGEELGDPEGAWKPGRPQPGDPAEVLNPGVKDAPPPGTKFIRGDTNQDSFINVVDGVVLVLSLFSGRPHSDCQAAEDSSSDGKVDVADAVYTFEYLYLGGPPPPAPFPSCGSRAGSLSCESFAPCT